MVPTFSLTVFLICALSDAGIYDKDAFSFPVAVADKDLQCWTPEHQNLVWPALCALCVYFPSATLTTAIKYSPEEDIRYVFLYNRLELITKGLMLFLSLHFVNDPILGLCCLMLGSCVVLAALHYMRPSCQKLAMRWKYFVHWSNIWTCLTCVGALYFDVNHTNWVYHLLAAGAGWTVIFILWLLIIWRNEQQDVMNAPVEEPTTILRACDEVQQLRHDIGHVQGPGAWGRHALILRLLDFATHESSTVRVCAFESLAVLSYWDHVTSEAFFIEMTPNTSMVLVLNAITTEQDESLRIFAVRVLGAFVRAEVHIKELNRFIEEDNGMNIPESIAKLACSTVCRPSQVDCMQTLLAITYVDSNTLDAVAENCVPMLGGWAQKGSLIEQHLAAELFMLISGRFDLTVHLIENGALPKLVSLFMAVDDIETKPEHLETNRSDGFKPGCLQPESAVVFAHQLPATVRQNFQRTYPRVRDIYHQQGDEDNYDELAHRAGRLEWSAWVNSGIPLSISIKEKLIAREFEGVSKVRSAGVTREHLDELFDCMCDSQNDVVSSKLTERTLDGKAIARFLSGYGLGDTTEIEQTMYDTAIYQHGIGELDDNQMHEELPRDLFCRWLVMSLPDNERDATLPGQEASDGVSLALRMLHECVPRSHEADCDAIQLQNDVQQLYDEIYQSHTGAEGAEVEKIVLRISDVARYLVETKQLNIGAVEHVEDSITKEVTQGEADVDAHVQLSALQLQIIKDEITKATTHTLTEIAIAQSAQGRADMVDGGVLVIISRCFGLFKPPEVHGLALNMLHALMNGRFSKEDIAHDGDLMGFYSEIMEFIARAERDPNTPPLLQFERLSALERRKAHMIAAHLGMYHRSVGSPVNRRVIISRIPITKKIVCKLLRAEMEETNDGDEDSEVVATVTTPVSFVNPIADTSNDMEQLEAVEPMQFVQVNAFEQDPPPIFEGSETNALNNSVGKTSQDIPVPELQELATIVEDNARTFQSVDDALEDEEMIFESSRKKIAKTGIIGAVSSCFHFRRIAPATWLFSLTSLLQLRTAQLLKLTDVNAKTGKPGAALGRSAHCAQLTAKLANHYVHVTVTKGKVPFYALDTLLQFSRFEHIPADTHEAVRERYLWALDHEDLGICTLGQHRSLSLHFDCSVAVTHQ